MFNLAARNFTQTPPAYAATTSPDPQSACAARSQPHKRPDAHGDDPFSLLIPYSDIEPLMHGRQTNGIDQRSTFQSLEILMSVTKQNKPVAPQAQDLEAKKDAKGGLLLPAVQAAREAARRSGG